MARNRASMREGPLAELFRATEAAQRQSKNEQAEQQQLSTEPPVTPKPVAKEPAPLKPTPIRAVAPAPDLEPEPAERAHIDVRHPHQGEACDQVSPPVVEQQTIASHQQDDGCDVMAEAVFTREDVEELSRDEPTARLAPRQTPLARFTEDFFVRDGPRNARDWKGENEENHALQDHEEPETTAIVERCACSVRTALMT